MGAGGWSNFSILLQTIYAWFPHLQMILSRSVQMVNKGFVHSVAVINIFIYVRSPKRCWTCPSNIWNEASCVGTASTVSIICVNETKLPDLGPRVPSQALRRERFRELSPASFLWLARESHREKMASLWLHRRPLGFPCSSHSLPSCEGGWISKLPFLRPLEIPCGINCQQTTIKLADAHRVCEDGMVLPRIALGNNVLISDGDLSFFAVNCA